MTKKAQVVERVYYSLEEAEQEAKKLEENGYSVYMEESVKGLWVIAGYLKQVNGEWL